MCTIGTVFDPTREGAIVFKQCDLSEDTHFLEPSVRPGAGDIRYVPFEREGAAGPWAGFNDRGVCFVSADAYLDPDAGCEVAQANEAFEVAPRDVLAAYTAILAACASAEEGVAYMASFYAWHGAPDIVLVADRDAAYLVEHLPGRELAVARFEAPPASIADAAGGLVRPSAGSASTPPCFVSATNHFRMQPGAVDFDDDPSTHLRLARSEGLLGAEPSLAGVFALLGDQHEGASERSVCRIAEQPGEFHTQASLVVVLGDGHVDCHYLLDAHPRMRPFERWTDVFGTSSPAARRRLARARRRLERG